LISANSNGTFTYYQRTYKNKCAFSRW
jgi:hypothetical protein